MKNFGRLLTVGLLATILLGAIFFLISKATARIEVPAKVTARNWTVTIVLEKPVQSNDQKWRSDCTGADCKIVSCTKQDTGEKNWVTDKTKVTQNAPVCSMVDDPATKREVVDQASCKSVPDKSSCTTKPDPGSCHLNDKDETVCDEVTVCEQKTVCGKKTVYDKKQVCEAQPNTYGKSATPIFADMCSVIITNWVPDGNPFVTTGTYELPKDPVIDWTTHVGARQKSYTKSESAVFTQSDGKTVEWGNGLFSGFNENLWSTLKDGQAMTIVYNGLGSIVEIKPAA